MTDIKNKQRTLCDEMSHRASDLGRSLEGFVTIRKFYQILMRIKETEVSEACSKHERDEEYIQIDKSMKLRVYRREENINIYSKEKGKYGVMIYLAYDRFKWQASVNKVTKFRVPSKAKKCVY
jgi:hypothetical protein